VRQLAKQEGAAPVAEGAEGGGGAEGAANAPAAGRGARGKAGRELGYSKDDLDVSGGAWKPGMGDTVLFDVVRVRATKQLVARRVRFVRAAPKPEVRPCPAPPWLTCIGVCALQDSARRAGSRK
jgi:hypothetical protein